MLKSTHLRKYGIAWRKQRYPYKLSRTSVKFPSTCQVASAVHLMYPDSQGENLFHIQYPIVSYIIYWVDPHGA